MKIATDERDLKEFKRIETLKRNIKTPVVGDFVKLNNGEIRRIGTISENSLQFAEENAGSFYLCINGSCTMSGSFESCIGLKLKKIGTHIGDCWFFSNGESGPDRGVYNSIEFNLFEEVEIIGPRFNYEQFEEVYQLEHLITTWYPLISSEDARDFARNIKERTLIKYEETLTYIEEYYNIKPGDLLKIRISWNDDCSYFPKQEEYIACIGSQEDCSIPDDEIFYYFDDLTTVLGTHDNFTVNSYVKNNLK